MFCTYRKANKISNRVSDYDRKKVIKSMDIYSLVIYNESQDNGFF